MNTVATEIDHAWRSLMSRKAYLVACAATLALVLGANAAIFAVVNATLVRPLPFVSDAGVVHLYMLPPGMSAVHQRNPLQQMDLVRVRERSQTLARVEAYALSERVVTLGGEPSVVESGRVTPGLLQMIGAPLQLGRPFLPEEEQPGHMVAIVTDRFWRDSLAAGPVLGSALVVDGEPHTIVGVLAATFTSPFLNAHVFTPLAPGPEPANRSPARVAVTIGELVPGATVTQASDEMAEMVRQLAQEFPRGYTSWTGGAESAREWLYGPVRRPVLMLFLATCLLLLIACANVANLTSAQAVSRSGELAVRVALGASRRDIARIHLAELVLLSLFGLIPGLLLSSMAVPALLAIDPVAARALGNVTIDWRVQIFSAGAALLTALGASAAPALRVMRGGSVIELAAGGRRTTGSAMAARVRRVLVAAEVALCLALLMAGAVLVRGLAELSERHPGYDAGGVLTAQIRLMDAAYPTEASRAAVVDRILQGIRSAPGVVAASTTMNNFVPGFAYQTTFHIESRPTPNGEPHSTQFRRISPDYFKTMNIPELSGRTFTDQDTAASPAVAVVSRQLADTLFPGEDAIGRTLLRTAPNTPPLTIVGIVGDVQDVSMTHAIEPTLYLPWSQNNNTAIPVAFVVRAAVEPTSLIPSVRAVVNAVDPSLPLRRVQTLDVFVGDSTAPERFRTTVLGIVGMLGLVLAALGIAGVTYRAVVDRNQEFAVRLALGSNGLRIVRLVLFESMRDVASGAVLGLMGGLAACLALARLIDNVGAAGVSTTGSAIVVLALAAFAASLLPALKVLRVAPADVLRR